jgi:geranyl-CoA carboxylase alpha subunit
MKTSSFNKILIANRGEIALRVMRTARRLGYRTVAVFSDADRNARHAREADESVYIGGSLPSESYLNISRIVEAARSVRADAVHPGYGFLAENEEFAAACTRAGLVFIGPSAEAIEAMGNKAAAKRIMLRAGVTCIPGYQGDAQDDATLARAANDIGFPVMIKAAAGGGGRGIRLVETTAEFTAALRTAKSEALSSFGDGRIIIEKAIVSPRHIEVQVFVDRYGNAVHLGERDCSVQRRHQKLVEEAPSPAVDAELRSQLGASAVAAAKSIQYEGAGTIEYLLDANRNFYFMEMNTRLQVEHPVTESITGLDLVELQLRVAAGEPLPFTQEEIVFHGHAIEVRLCSEDADKSFVPQSGVLGFWRAPEGVRVEHALESGTTISPFYDSMIAKVIATGANRDDARRQLVSALENLVALGVTTNQAFLASCLRHPVFAAGGATTAFIGQEARSLFARDGRQELEATAVAALLLYLGAGDSRPLPRPTALTSRLPVNMRFELEGAEVAAIVINTGPSSYAVSVDARSFEFTLEGSDGLEVRLLRDGIGASISGFRTQDGHYWFRYAGRARRALDRRFDAAARAGAASDGLIRASMSGRVVGVHAAVGDRLKIGAPVFTLEAMKMEHVHVAPCAGRLVSLSAKSEEQVTAQRILAEIQKEEQSTS